MKKFIFLFLLWGIFCNAQYNLFARQNFSVQKSTYDSDAQAFITAAGLADVTQKDAINTLVVDLKANSLWTKFQAVYPFVGGTAFTHKWNLKDPRDLDVAFRLDYLGVLTHSATGVLPVALGRMNTFYIPSINSTINNFQMSAYTRTNVSNAYLFYAIHTDGASTGIIQFFSRISNLLLSDMYNSSGGSSTRVLVSNSDSKGFYAASRILASTKHSIYKNGVLQTSNTGSGGSLPNDILTIGSGVGGATQGLEYAFATIGHGLTDAENATLYTIIQAYQTTLGRQN